MSESQVYTIREVMDLWNQAHPSSPVSRQTIYNWTRKFGWAENAERLLCRQKININKKKFDQFNSNPMKFLESSK